MVALPVTLPHLRRRVTERGARDHLVLPTVADAAVVLAPRHLGGIGCEVGAGDVVVNAHLGASEAGEERLGLVRAGFVGAVGDLMVDAVRLERLVQPIPTLRLVGMNYGAGGDARLNRLHTLRLGAEGKSECLALTLSDHDDDAALTRLVLGEAAILPVRLHVLGTDVPAEIGAIHLNRTRHGRVGRLSRHGLAQLVSHDEGRPVLDVEIAAELERAVTFGAVGENGDGKQMVADWELAAGEDGPARDAVLVPATSALEQLAGGDERVLEATAAWAEGGAVSLSPTDRLERLPSRLIRHPRDLGEAERAGGAREKEVLSHNGHPNVLR